MPRDGSNVYHYPTGIEGNPDEVIESAGYNSFLADVEQDANLPRPILAGGTGATSADAALAALGAEKSKQGPVTNFDTFPWVNGSFSSNAGATGAPTSGYAYIGIYYEHIDPQLQAATIEARSVGEGSAGQLFIRQKTSGVWGAWSNTDTKVNRAGDTMTNTLQIKVPADFVAHLILTSADNNQNKYIRVINDGTLQWINNANTQVVMSLSDVGNLTANSLISTTGPDTGSFIFGSNFGKSLNCDGTNFNFVGAPLSASGYKCHAGLLGAYPGNYFNINHGTGQQLWIDNTNVGTFAYTSDYRTKKDVINLPSTWSAVKELHPIKYSHKDFTPPSEKDSREPFMKGDNIERWGFLAHELQETLIESAATGVKDSPNIVQSPNPWTIIAALTRTLQEAMARIEVLESRET